MTDPLELPLRDIHLPGEITFWPPAPGWWILMALVITAMVVGWLLYQRNRRYKLSATRMAGVQLQEIITRYETDKDPVELLRQLSILLRRLSISLFPRTEVASLTGQDWLAFLDRQTRQDNFSTATGRLLCEAVYRREVRADEAELVLKYSQDWIKSVAAGSKR